MKTLMTWNQFIAERIEADDMAAAIVLIKGMDEESRECWTQYIEEHFAAGGLWLSLEQWKQGREQAKPSVVAFMLDNDGDLPDDCPICHGSGEDESGDHRCNACAGTGKRGQPDHTYTVDVTLRCTFTAGSTFDHEDVTAMFMDHFALPDTIARLQRADGALITVHNADAEFIETEA